MRLVLVCFFLFPLALVGCILDEQSLSEPTTSLGSDKDEHGCIASAGYRWCAKTEKCERPWELAKQVNIANTLVDFDQYCGE